MPNPEGFKSAIDFLLAKQPDLTIRQIGVLLNCAASSQTVRGLSAAMETSKPAITRAIDKLEDLGWATR